MSDPSCLRFQVAGSEEWTALVTAQRWVYWNKESTDPIDGPEPGEHGYLVWEGDEAVSACQSYEYPVIVRGKELLMGGVAGVATLIEGRRTGAAHLLMEGLLRDHHAKKIPLSCLYAFRETYYRRFGYELCGWRWENKCPADRLPKLESHLKVRRIPHQDAAQELGPCYNDFIQKLSGCHVRGPESWQDRLGQNPPTIYAVGDPVEGYLWGSFAGFWEDVTIGEFVWSTPEGYRALLGLLRSIASNKTGVVWIEPPVSPLQYVFRDQGITSTLHRPTMWRITHLEAALSSLDNQEPFSFELQDGVIPQHNGVFTLQPGGRLEEGGAPDFSLDIRALSQAFMGQPSLTELADLGRINVLSAEGFARASRSLTPQNVVCMEFF
jgi:predicted acetyltransferase